MAFSRNVRSSFLNDPSFNSSVENENFTDYFEPSFANHAVYNFIFAAISLMIAVVAIVGNMLVAGGILHDRRFRTYTNCFIAALACADIGNGVEVWIRGVHFILGVEWAFGRIACEIFKFFSFYTVQMTYFLIMIIAIDRFFAIVYPIRHLRVKSCEYATRLIVGAYASQVFVIAFYLYALPYILGSVFVNPPGFCRNRNASLKASMFYFTISRYIPVLITSSSYFSIYYLSRQRRKKKTNADNSGEDFFPG